jgi:branched-chain amino acid transport system substrate-binding protein
MFSLTLVFVAMIAGATIARGQERKSIKIGYAVSLNSPGAIVNPLNNYRLWFKEVNAAGGIMLSSIGKRLPIEVVEYDDHSNVDDAVKAIDRLIRNDKVDFILPPWGSELNQAIAPILNSAGYPLLATTSWPPPQANRLPNCFWFLGTPAGAAEALIDLIAGLKAEGKVGLRVALISLGNQFGIGLAKPARAALKKDGFELVYDRAYPEGVNDMRPMLREIKELNPDIFIAFSYPPDTMAINTQARELGLSPKVFYTSVGTYYESFKQHFGSDAEGVMGIGGWNPDSPAIKAYIERHAAATGHEPDGWASPVTYASLQMLQQAIERVGKIDRAAVIKELQTGTFQTIVGPIKLKNNRYAEPWYVGQWQHGKYYGVAPVSKPGAHKVVFPKPPWHANN